VFVGLQADLFGLDSIEPCFIDETAEVDPTAKIGPNVSIGELQLHRISREQVKPLKRFTDPPPTGAGVKIGYGCRVKESIILDNTVLDASCWCSTTSCRPY
jgi:mannose-1-phosphate guanylyltransferase